MELLNFLSQVPIPVLILVIAVLVVVIAVVVYQYAKAKGLDGIRKEVYKLFLHAEHIYKESGQGENIVTGKQIGRAPRLNSSHSAKSRMPSSA